MTLSTSGLVPEIERVGTELPINWSVSLNPVDDKIRKAICLGMSNLKLAVANIACTSTSCSSNEVGSLMTAAETVKKVQILLFIEIHIR